MPIHAAPADGTPSPPAPAARWLPWLIGLSLLAAVVLVALHIADARAFAVLVEEADPGWLAAALALQGATYLCQAQLWRQVMARAGGALPLGPAFRLSLVKLLVDQALPSSGLSGSVAVGGALRQRGASSATAAAAIVVGASSYLLAYAIAVGSGLALMGLDDALQPAVGLAGALFIAAAIAGALALRHVVGRERLVRRLQAMLPSAFHGLAEQVAAADRRLVGSSPLLGQAVALQLGIVLLDAGTLWVLLRALGTEAPVSMVFASFMFSTVLRTVSIVPGGLGAFEAASVLTLHGLGVSVAAALSATLLFRGLSSWLPLLPAAVLARRLLQQEPARAEPAPDGGPYWSLDPAAVLEQLHAAPGGLSSAEASRRLQQQKAVSLEEPRAARTAALLASQMRSPLVLMLLFGAGVSLFLRDWAEAGIILFIVLGSSLLGFSQEYRAGRAVDALRRRLQLQVRVLRDGQEASLPTSAVVPGDVVRLAAGNLVPADGLVLQARDFLVSEASLTGESFPVEKSAGRLPAATTLGGRSNCVHLGTSVRSGTATVLVVATGRQTALGAIAAHVAARPPESEFARGVCQFGHMLLRTMVLVVLLVIGANQLLDRPALDSLLFAVALAVGLTPELLPAIVSVTLSRGAREMAARGVIVRRLEAIEDLGGMEVLCTDKTGTLTEGSITLEAADDAQGRPSAEALRLAFLNAWHETGIANPIDAAIVAAGQSRGLDRQPATKVDEIPYDFTRKRLTVVVEDGASDRHLLITKGAFASVLAVCDIDPRERVRCEQLHQRWSEDGYRVLAVAVRRGPARARYTHEDEAGLVLAGFVRFLDPARPGIAQTLRDLGDLGIRTKVISGDNRHVVAHLARGVGLDAGSILTGEQLAAMKDESLWSLAPRTTLFVDVDPQQKERIVRALQHTGHTVGYLGDGINDAPALHAADVGISVQGATDVARESADVVLLERDLAVLRRGVEDGRATFANTLKYIGITTSANFGNMVSMAVATPLLPFLPLAAKQILLNNFISDLPSAAISTDRIDPGQLRTAQAWDVAQVRRYMVVFGLTSTCFDLLAFFVLLRIFQAQEAAFQTAWFVISLLTELAVVLVLRTHGPAWRSRPSALLAGATAAAAALAVALPYLGPVAALFGFVPLPWHLMAAALAIVLLYVVATEAVKLALYRRGP